VYNSVFKILVSNFKSNLISETNCSVHSWDPQCQDPNEACNIQSDYNGVCKCKPGYSKQHPSEPCIQVRPNTASDSHSEDQPATPEAEYSSKVSGNDETCRLVHTNSVWEVFCLHL